MAVKVRKNLPIGYWPQDWLAGFVEQNGWSPHNVTAGSASVDLLNGVTHHACDAVLVIWPRAWGLFGKSPGDERNGVVAAFAVAGKGNALLGGEQIDVAQVIRDAVGVGVHRLAPLLMCFLVAV